MIVLKQTIYTFKQKLSIGLIFFIGVTSSIQSQARPQDPDAPAIERPIHISDQGQYEIPIVPVFRTTRDGRLSYNVKSNRSTLKLYLNAPEKISQNFHDSPNGPALLATTNAYTINTQTLRATRNGGGNTHTAICEVPDTQGNQKNPYACGADDCYDVVFIQSGSADSTNQQRFLQGTPGTVRVRNPKTPDARIIDVDLGTTTVSPHRLDYQQLFEIQTTEDGHLLVGRVENSRLIPWRNRRTNQDIRGRYDMVYSPGANDPSRACDVTQWDELKPLGHAPYDPEINTRYGFAMQPFRDAQGNVIPDNTDLVGSYPWIDAKGNNIGFATFGVRTNFPVLCVPGRACDNNNFPNGAAPLMGKMIAGLWTQGKMILVDNLVNHSDYAQPQQEDSGHRLLDMYRAGTGPNANSTGLIRVGHGRDNTGAAGLPANAENTTFQESTENKLNFWKNLRPVTPSDVVWHHSSGAGSDELAFDDFLYENSFIVSSMVQSTTNNGNAIAQFVGDSRRVQNAAASEHWNVPAFGSVVGARIERVALGGVHGKGLFLEGNQRIDYTIANQPRNIRNNDWQISLFIDARFNNDTAIRNVINFPDGSELQLMGRERVRYWKDGAVLHAFDLPNTIPQEGWAHIGVQMSNANRTATFYLNGFAADRHQSNQSFFEMTNGVLSVGDHVSRGVNGIRAWVDDFKVIAHNTNVEGWCSQANGQLVGSNGSNHPLRNIALSYPNSSHLDISEVLSRTGEEEYSFYACYVDYSGDYLAREDTIPNGFNSIRESINFPEGPIVHDEPRPDSIDNAFCLQCHTPTAPLGLGLPALTFDGSLSAANDPRRQPLQPPARVFGHVPANWLGQGLPASALVAPPGGFPIDEALLPNDNPSPLWEGSQTLNHVSTGMKLSAANQDVELVDINVDNDNAQWEIVNARNGYVFIYNVGRNMRLREFELDVELVANNFSGELVQWLIEPTGDGLSFFFTNRVSGRKLHASRSLGNIPNTVEARFTGNNVRWQLGN